MRRLAPLPEEFSRAPFTVAAAREAGLNPGRLRASDLAAPFHGVRVRRAAAEADSTGRDDAREEMLRRCIEYRPRLKPGQYFSHRSAAAIYGIPLPTFAPTEVHVTSATSGRPRTTGVVGHRSPPGRSVAWRGFPVTHPTWLLSELAAELTVDDLVLAGDALVRRKRAPTTLEALRGHSVVHRAPGIHRLRAALDLTRPGTDSPMETRLRLLIVRAGLPEPVIGYTITDAWGGFIGTPDLAYPDLRIAIEYEGSAHRTDSRTFADDIERRELMQEQDWYVIRVIAGHVLQTPDWLVQRIARVLEARRG